MLRSGLEESQVRAIMAVQASRAVRLAAADDVVTTAAPAALQEQVAACTGLLELAARTGACDMIRAGQTDTFPPLIQARA
jgi:hypothetical protein